MSCCRHGTKTWQSGVYESLNVATFSEFLDGPADEEEGAWEGQVVTTATNPPTPLANSGQHWLRDL